MAHLHCDSPGTVFRWAGHAQKCRTFVRFGSHSHNTLFMRSKLPGQLPARLAAQSARLVAVLS